MIFTFSLLVSLARATESDAIVDFGLDMGPYVTSICNPREFNVIQLILSVSTRMDDIMNER